MVAQSLNRDATATSSAIFECKQVKDVIASPCHSKNPDSPEENSHGAADRRERNKKTRTPSSLPKQNHKQPSILQCLCDEES